MRMVGGAGRTRAEGVERVPDDRPHPRATSAPAEMVHFVVACRRPSDYEPPFGGIGMNSSCTPDRLTPTPIGQRKPERTSLRRG